MLSVKIPLVERHYRVLRPVHGHHMGRLPEYRACGRASPTTSCARSPTSPRSLPRLLKRRDLAIGARAGAQRTGARGADGAATAGPHQRSLLRPSVARATGRPRERPSCRGAGAVGGSSGEACRSAAPPTAPLASRRVAQTEQRPLDRTSGRCSAHPSRTPPAGLWKGSELNDRQRCWSRQSVVSRDVSLPTIGVASGQRSWCPAS